ncbi:MAG TPA: hypothetical protein VM095_05240 [Pyrinomonadaceae bacterium]|nr:hypothetical protein [Pyrinomonadaceae bacterium]
MSNDNRPETRAELEATNRALRMSLKKCEAMVEACREKLAAAQARLRWSDIAGSSDRQRDGRR